MKWKEMLLGALITLVITVVSGIAVYYSTKEPDSKTQEKLQYFVTQSGDFKGGAENVALSSLTLTNSGGISAKNISVAVKYPLAQIKDISITSGSGSKDLSHTLEGSDAHIVFPVLLPTETVHINFLLSAPDQPDIVVRSDASLGQAVTQPAQGLTQKERWNSISGKAVPVAAGITSVLLIAFLTKWRNYKVAPVDTNSKNNAAFMLLHSGFPERAQSILERALDEGDCDAATLSNLAFCKALAGNVDESAKLIHAAKFQNPQRHGLAVVLFNEALIDMHLGRRDQAFKNIRLSIEKSKKDIRDYIRRSCYFDGIRNDAELLELLRD